VRYTQVTGAVVLGGIALGPLAGVLLGATAAILRFTTRGSQSRWMIIATHSLNRPYLKMRYVLALGSDQSAGKEVRVLGILPWLHARISADAADYLNPLWQERRRVYFIPFLVVSALVLAGTLTLLTLLRSEAAAGTVSVLGLALAIQAILVPVRMGTFFPDIDPKTMWGLAAHDAICELEALIPARPRASNQVQPCGLHTGQTLSSIRFEEVRFTYPGSDRAVLSGLNLELTPGESTAIVGLNGAGKTTIIKLLAGLYQPTGGRITVDGLDLRDILPRDWQSRLAVIFQDYVRYQLDAAANIGLGAAARMGDDAALRAAAEDAGAAEIIDALPAGLATPLSSAFTGGVQLSGGQWQRIALARALFAVKAGADLLVLDEPTAQLDARAEVTFFNRFLDLTRGLTSVVISHRFSTVRRADRIVVLEGGRIHEQGSHAELLGAGGRYAELFHLQARRFTATQGNRAGEAQ
jgi:ATP-binding cassette subfamily B protein